MRTLLIIGWLEAVAFSFVAAVMYAHDHDYWRAFALALVVILLFALRTTITNERGT